MKEIVHAHFGGQLRLRACGILVEDGKILLIAHKGLSNADLMWLPPGGGVAFGERMEECLKREFREETGLEIEVGPFLFVHEFIREPLHALEIFFQVYKKSGGLKLGKDPELNKENQIMKDIRWMDKNSISKLAPEEKHKILREENDPNRITQLKGSFILSN
jgi:8-oxo-dGTP diphosphatase